MTVSLRVVGGSASPEVDGVVSGPVVKGAARPSDFTLDNGPSDHEGQLGIGGGRAAVTSPVRIAERLSTGTNSVFAAAY